MIAIENTTQPPQTRGTLNLVRAVAMVIAHGVTLDLPEPVQVNVDAGDADVPHFFFDDLADLYVWATYVDEPVTAEWIDRSAGIRRHHFTGTVLDLQVRFLVVALEVGGDL